MYLTESFKLPQQRMMKSQRVCLLLLIVFPTISLSQEQNLGYRNFINQHVNAAMSIDQCDRIIGSRRISQPNSNLCKETNTFIRATLNPITAICSFAGEHYGQLTKSTNPFDIVVCKLRNGGEPNNPTRVPHCQYRGQARTRLIAIRCEGRFPVHYGADIVYFD